MINAQIIPKNNSLNGLRKMSSKDLTLFENANESKQLNKRLHRLSLFENILCK